MTITESDVNRLVLGYVKDKKYTKTKEAFIAESRSHSANDTSLKTLGNASLVGILQEYTWLKEQSETREACPICGNNGDSLPELWTAFDQIVSLIKSYRPKPISPSCINKNRRPKTRCNPRMQLYDVSSSTKLVPLASFGPMGEIQKKQLKRRTYELAPPSENNATLGTPSTSRSFGKAGRRKKTTVPKAFRRPRTSSDHHQSDEMHENDGDLSTLLNFTDKNDTLALVGAKIITNMKKCAEKRLGASGDTPIKNASASNYVSPIKNPGVASLDIDCLNNFEGRGNLVDMTLDSLLTAEQHSIFPAAENFEFDFSELRKLLDLDELPVLPENATSPKLINDSAVLHGDTGCLESTQATVGGIVSADGISDSTTEKACHGDVVDVSGQSVEHDSQAHEKQTSEYTEVVDSSASGTTETIAPGRESDLEKDINEHIVANDNSSADVAMHENSMSQNDATFRPNLVSQTDENAEIMNPASSGARECVTAPDSHNSDDGIVCPDSVPQTEQRLKKTNGVVSDATVRDSVPPIDAMLCGDIASQNDLVSKNLVEQRTSPEKKAAVQKNVVNRSADVACKHVTPQKDAAVFQNPASPIAMIGQSVASKDDGMAHTNSMSQNEHMEHSDAAVTPCQHTASQDDGTLCQILFSQKERSAKQSENVAADATMCQDLESQTYPKQADGSGEAASQGPLRVATGHPKTTRNHKNCSTEILEDTTQTAEYDTVAMSCASMPPKKRFLAKETPEKCKSKNHNRVPAKIIPHLNLAIEAPTTSIRPEVTVSPCRPASDALSTASSPAITRVFGADRGNEVEMNTPARQGHLFDPTISDSPESVKLIDVRSCALETSDVTTSTSALRSSLSENDPQITDGMESDAVHSKTRTNTGGVSSIEIAPCAARDHILPTSVSLSAVTRTMSYADPKPPILLMDPSVCPSDDSMTRMSALSFGFCGVGEDYKYDPDSCSSEAWKHLQPHTATPSDRQNSTTAASSITPTSAKSSVSSGPVSTPRVNVMKPGAGSFVLNLKNAGRTPLQVQGIVVGSNGPKQSLQSIIDQLVSQVGPTATAEKNNDAAGSSLSPGAGAAIVEQPASSPQQEDATLLPPELVSVSDVDCPRQTTLNRGELDDKCLKVATSPPVNKSSNPLASLPPDLAGISFVAQLEDSNLGSMCLKEEYPEASEVTQCHTVPLVSSNISDRRNLAQTTTTPKRRFRDNFSTISPSAGVFWIMEDSVDASRDRPTTETLDSATINLFGRPDQVAATESEMRKDTPATGVPINTWPTLAPQKKQQDTVLATSSARSDFRPTNVGLPDASTLLSPHKPQTHNLPEVTNQPRPTVGNKLPQSSRPVSTGARRPEAKLRSLGHRPRVASAGKRPQNVPFLCNQAKNMVNIKPKQYSVQGVRKYFFPTTSEPTAAVSEPYSIKPVSVVLEPLKVTSDRPISASEIATKSSSTTEWEQEEQQQKPATSKTKTPKKAKGGKGRGQRSMQQRVEDDSQKISAHAATTTKTYVSGGMIESETPSMTGDNINNDKISRDSSETLAKPTPVPLSDRASKVREKCVQEDKNVKNPEKSPARHLVTGQNQLSNCQSPSDLVIMSSNCDASPDGAAEAHSHNTTTSKAHKSFESAKSASTDSAEKPAVDAQKKKGSRKRKGEKSDHRKSTKARKKTDLLKSPVRKWSYDKIQAKLNMLYASIPGASNMGGGTPAPVQNPPSQVHEPGTPTMSRQITKPSDRDGKSTEHETEQAHKPDCLRPSPPAQKTDDSEPKTAAISNPVSQGLKRQNAPKQKQKEKCKLRVRLHTSAAKKKNAAKKKKKKSKSHATKNAPQQGITKTVQNLETQKAPLCDPSHEEREMEGDRTELQEAVSQILPANHGDNSQSGFSECANQHRFDNHAGLSQSNTNALDCHSNADNPGKTPGSTAAAKRTHGGNCADPRKVDAYIVPQPKSTLSRATSVDGSRIAEKRVRRVLLTPVIPSSEDENSKICGSDPVFFRTTLEAKRENENNKNATNCAPSNKVTPTNSSILVLTACNHLAGPESHGPKTAQNSKIRAEQSHEQTEMNEDFQSACENLAKAKSQGSKTLLTPQNPTERSDARVETNRGFQNACENLARPKPQGQETAEDCVKPTKRTHSRIELSTDFQNTPGGGALSAGGVRILSAENHPHDRSGTERTRVRKEMNRDFQNASKHLMGQKLQRQKIAENSRTGQIFARIQMNGDLSQMDDNDNNIHPNITPGARTQPDLPAAGVQILSSENHTHKLSSTETLEKTKHRIHQSHSLNGPEHPLRPENAPLHGPLRHVQRPETNDHSRVSKKRKKKKKFKKIDLQQLDIEKFLARLNYDDVPA